MRSSKTPLLKYLEKNLFESRNAPLPYAAKPNMKPSFLGTPCLRKIYYNFLRVPPDFPWEVSQIKIFEKGDAFHEVAKRWLSSAGLLIPYRDASGNIPKHWKTGAPDPEFPVNDPDLNIKNAKIDAVGIVKQVPGIEDGLWVFEIKSINQKGFERYLLAGPKAEHQEQAMTYAFLFEAGLQRGDYSHISELDGQSEVKGVIFIYLNRENDSDDWREFVLPKNGETFLKVAEKVIATQAHVAANTLPPKTEDFCAWCSFRNKCKAEFKVDTSL